MCRFIKGIQKIISANKSPFKVFAVLLLISAQTARAETIKMKCEMHLVHLFGIKSTPQYQFLKFESGWFGKGRAFVRVDGGWAEFCSTFDLKPNATKEKLIGGTSKRSCIYGDKSVKYIWVWRNEVGQIFNDYPKEILLHHWKW